MKAKLTILFISVITLNSYAQQVSKAQQFWDALKQHCGKAYQGEMTQGLTEEFKKGPLIMHVKSCEDGVMKIPFFVGENRSRTWVVTLNNNRIKLKHDHRHEDGSEDKVTQYGGTATSTGSAFQQIFPADQETVDLLPNAASNVWWITIDKNFFTYNLRRVNSDRVVTVKFDLSKPVDTPADPWGWKK
ncbi:MAG: hypothetical protein EOO90_08165 [Pedobacter sp.]|nr:MAG: hypothetical protein EOO90_08165 [Pedobacter sp.]